MSSSEQENKPLFLDRTYSRSSENSTTEGVDASSLSALYSRRNPQNRSGSAKQDNIADLSRSQIFFYSLFPFLLGSLAAAGILYLYLFLKGNLP